MSEVKQLHSVSQTTVPVNRTEIIRDLCRQAHREAAIDTDLGLKPLGYSAAKALCEKVWDIAAQQSTDSHEELVEALGEVPCVECGHPLRLHVDQYGCEFDRGDGYRMGSEYEVALGPCACHGGESDKKAIAALAKAGRP